MRGRRAQEGHSLVDVLVATAVMGLLMSATLSLLQSGLAAWSWGTGRGEAQQALRAWDVRTGKLVWTFHSVPRAGEPFNDTWAGDSWVKRSGVNVWGLMTVDVERGIVFMPFGAPANDRIGVDRPGNNLFSSSVVAADARTGKYLWHFQIVHHDIWDNDAEAPPTLFDVRSATGALTGTGS